MTTTTAFPMFSRHMFDNHVETVKAAALDTFTNIGVEPQFVYKGEEDAPCDGVVGIISIVGDVAWSLMVGVPRESAESLTVAFTGFEVAYDSADMGDVVGELANVLAGFVVNHLEGIGVSASLSLPTVVRGSHVEMMIPEGQPAARLNFDSTRGKFWIKVAVARSAHGYRS